MSAVKRRMTSQRRVILEELRKVTSHPTADEIYEMTRKRLPRISLGTVYRNLEQMAESGDILKLEMCGTQKRFDGNPDPHFHVRCLSCGCVRDVHSEITPPDVTDCLVKGFDVTGYYLELVGICDRCQGSDQESH